MKISEVLVSAIEAAEIACNEILEVYQSSDFQTESKDDKSPLTLADKRAHAAIVSVLKETGLPILSEEGKMIPYEERKLWEYFWMVDPLDGTKEFLKRNGEFTVNIALIYHEKPILGVVAVPASGDVFYAAEGKACLKRNRQTISLPKRSPVSLTQNGLRVVASRSHMSPETQDFINALTAPSLVSKGSSLKFMLLAEGQADVYPRFAPTMEWDTAAAHAIVNAVGISVKQRDRDEELRYNKEDLLNPYFLCL
ncbi:MAG: 3'(2'),5'-bisphosphate nucleotidase CysQ [Cyclobacteriaceae bacterium]|nr:3'(2'),5'-bisphosphate nucleotidase CysQ [Cyclobacteriaceae bacterium]UYN85612.1 MAG: 3'(2'),5'-bisphosphate nucleotidase CysQ [Cyclobacteriaceae bacterium]